MRFRARELFALSLCALAGESCVALPRMHGHPHSGSSDHGKVSRWERIPKKFRDQIVELHRKRGRTFMELSRKFNISATSISNWGDPAGQTQEGRTFPCSAKKS